MKKFQNNNLKYTYNFLCQCNYLSICNDDQILLHILNLYKKITQFLKIIKIVQNYTKIFIYLILFLFNIINFIKK